MNKLIGATLVALAAFGFADADADDDDDSSRYRHRAKCKILAVEVTDEPRLIIDGVGLRKSKFGPTVSFGGIELVVDPESTSEHIEAILSAEDIADVPKDYLLEIKRSRRDFGCPRHMVTVVPQLAQEVVCPTSCADEIKAFMDDNTFSGFSFGECKYDEVRKAGEVAFDLVHAVVPNSVLSIKDAKCFIAINAEPSVDIALTDEEQAACAPLAKAAAISRGVTTEVQCKIEPD